MIIFLIWFVGAGISAGVFIAADLKTANPDTGTMFVAALLWPLAWLVIFGAYLAEKFDL